MVLYIISKFPHPLLVISLVGCSVIYIVDEIEEIKNDKTKNKENKRKLK